QSHPHYSELHSFPTRRSSDLWIQEVADHPLSFPSDFERLTLVRAYLVVGKYAEARRELEPLPREAAQRSRSMIEYLILLALVLQDRKSTRLNSSHRTISYAVF